jgi:hypothetical protein
LVHPPQDPAKEKDKKDDADEQHQGRRHKISESIERRHKKAPILIGQHYWATLGNVRRNWTEDSKPMEARGRICALARLTGAILDQAR